MAENKKSILIYCDLIHVVDSLEDEEAGKLFKHLMRYVNDLNPEAPDRLTKLLFEPIKQNLKRDLVKWEQKSERNSEIAKAAWGKRKDANAYERKRTKPDEADNVTVTVIDNVNVTDKVNDEDEKQNSTSATPEPEFGKLIYFDLKKIEQVLGSDENYISDCAMRHRSEIENVKLAIPDYILQLKTDKVERKERKDMYKHFNNWLRIHLEKSKQNGKSKNGTSKERIIGRIPISELQEFIKPRNYPQHDE